MKISITRPQIVGIILIIAFIPVVISRLNSKSVVNNVKQTTNKPLDIDVGGINDGEDGLSYSTAVIVSATTEDAGIPWEHAWLEKNACLGNGGYKDYSRQSLSNDNGHYYDIMSSNCLDGASIDYYFMIDNFLGK